MPNEATPLFEPSSLSKQELKKLELAFKKAIRWVLIHYPQFRNSRYFVGTVAGLLIAGKLSSSVGQGVFSSIKAMKERGADELVSEIFAGVTCFSSFWTTIFSRGPAIVREVRGKRPHTQNENEQFDIDVEDITLANFQAWFKEHLHDFCASYRAPDCNAEVIFVTSVKLAVHMCGYISSCFVFLAAYLGGKTLVNKYLIPMLNRFFNEAISVQSENTLFNLVGFFTAVCAWFSFFAYTINKVRDNGQLMGQAIANWLRSPSIPSWRALVIILLSTTIIASSAFKAYFFAKHAIPDCPLTSWIPEAWVKPIAGGSLFASSVTSAASRVAAIGDRVVGKKPIKPPSPEKFLAQVVVKVAWSIAVAELTTSATGNNVSCLSLFKDLGWDIPEYPLDSWQRWAAEAMIVILFNFPDMLQNFFFTIFDFIVELIKIFDPDSLKPEYRIQDDHDFHELQTDVEAQLGGQGIYNLSKRKQPSDAGVRNDRYSLFSSSRSSSGVELEDAYYSESSNDSSNSFDNKEIAPQFLS